MDTNTTNALRKIQRLRERAGGHENKAKDFNALADAMLAALLDGTPERQLSAAEMVPRSIKRQKPPWPRPFNRPKSK